MKKPSFLRNIYRSIQFLSLILFSLLKVFPMFLHLLFKECSSLPTNCAVTYKDLMSRYLLVKDKYQPQLSTPNWNGRSTKCPWTWQIHKDVDRLPQNIVYAQCGSSCNEWLCKPVKYYTLILKREKNEWKIRTKRITVAYVYISNFK